MQIINHEGIPQNLPLSLKITRGQSIASRSEDFRLGWAWAKQQVYDYGASGAETVKDTCGGEGADEFDIGAMSYIYRSNIEEV